MNYWQTWLQMFSQTQTTASTAANPMNTFNAQMSKQFTSQYAEQWQQACKQWQSSMEGAWSSPASFWQAVSSIQSARARFIAEFCQQQPQYLAQLFQCTSYPQLVECLTRWNGHTLTSMTNLNMVTQSQRSNLMSEWKHNMPALANPKALTSMWNASNFWKSATGTTTHSNTFSNFANTGTSPAPKPQSSASSATYSAPSTSTSAAASQNTPSTPAQPSAASHSTMTPVTVQSAQSPASSITAHVSVPTAAPLNAPTVPSMQIDQLNLTGGSTSTTTTTPVQGAISSTANSVMRTSTGSTIAAAAARRSVVARRSTNTRRRASR